MNILHRGFRGTDRLITAACSGGIYRRALHYGSSRLVSYYGVGAGTAVQCRRGFAFDRRSSRNADANELRSQRLTRLKEARAVPSANNVAPDTTITMPIVNDDSTTTTKTDMTWTSWAMHYAAALVVRRQLEPLNLFLGFEQANRYTIEDDQGRPVAYLAEEETTFSSAIARQLLRTHRPFKAVIMDNEGHVILKLQRPWTWINTHIYVMDAQDNLIGQVIQQWHLWRRRYELFIHHDQFAQVDAGFLAWRFELTDEQGKIIACVDRRFGGFAREIFTDTGQYALLFHPNYLTTFEGHGADQLSHMPLTGDQRAVVLACAVGIDFDYFSRHSHGGMIGGGLFPMPFTGRDHDTIDDISDQ